MFFLAELSPCVAQKNGILIVAPADWKNVFASFSHTTGGYGKEESPNRAQAVSSIVRGQVVAVPRRRGGRSVPLACLHIVLCPRWCSGVMGLVTSRGIEQLAERSSRERERDSGVGRWSLGAVACVRCEPPMPREGCINLVYFVLCRWAF